MSNSISPHGYPLEMEIPLASRQSRSKALFRVVLSLPVLLFAVLVNVGATLPIWATIVARGRVPQWLFDYQVGVNRWQLRAAAFVLCLRDEYPAFGGEQPVTYDLANPERPSRWQVAIWKSVSAIPHVFALLFVTLSLVPVSLVAWVMLLLRGRYPVRLHWYSSGALRWMARTQAYVLSLTDIYPPFSLAHAPGLPSRRSHVLGVAGGTGFLFVSVTLFGLIVAFQGTHEVREVPYGALIRGELPQASTSATVESGLMMIASASDPADDELRLLQPSVGTHFVAFQISIENYRGANETVPVKSASFSLEDAEGGEHEPILVAVNGTPGEGTIGQGETGEALVVFEIAGTDPPRMLKWDVVDYISFPRVGETIEWVFR